MIRYLLVVCSVGMFSACTTYTPRAQTEQYCDLKTETVSIKKNGKVIGEETVEVMKCNDNKVDRLFHAQSGMAKDCGEFKTRYRLKNRDVEGRGYACQKYDGTYEIVPHPSMFQ